MVDRRALDCQVGGIGAPRWESVMSSKSKSRSCCYKTHHPLDYAGSPVSR